MSGLLAVALVACPVGALAKSEPIDRDDFRADMRQLWEDHIGWTRLFIVEAVGGLPGKDATAERLLKNQDDIGNAIKPFYGEEAGAKLTALLRDHILIAADLVGAAKAGDSAKQDDATKRWFANADEIAGFLSGANSKHWPADATKTMMHDHLKLTTEVVVAQLKGDWAASIAASDKVHEQILHMADALTDGIQAQHPQHFKG
ncbi:MAG TPA: glycosyltransferase [Thermoanaerobaculia bacterium]|nr:glycosyltransferase [Thermoanaerobaculia bacterium]